MMCLRHLRLNSTSSKLLAVEFIECDHGILSISIKNFILFKQQEKHVSLDNRRTEPQGITRGIYRNYIAQDLHKKG